MTVCERVDALRKEKKLSRRKLAIMAGIKPSTFQSALERNGKLSLDIIFPISEVLGVSPIWLAKGTLPNGSETNGALPQESSSQRRYVLTPKGEALRCAIKSGLIPKVNGVYDGTAFEKFWDMYLRTLFKYDPQSGGEGGDESADS